MTTEQIDLYRGVQKYQGEWQEQDEVVHVKYGHADPETLRDNIIDVIGEERYGQLKEKSRNYGRPFKMDLGDLAELKARLADQLRREEGA